MRVMKDGLIVRLAITCTFGAGVWLSFVKSFIEPAVGNQVLKVILFLFGGVHLGYPNF